MDRGGVSSVSTGTVPALNVGYAAIRPGTGSATPAGLAIFGFRQNNILVSEAGVPASPAVRSGRIYAEVNGPVTTGIAIANPNNQPVTIAFYRVKASPRFPLAQVAKFLDQPPFNAPAASSGTFTFSSSSPVAVIALRGFTNERGEFLITTLPVADLTNPATGTIKGRMFEVTAEGIVLKTKDGPRNIAASQIAKVQRRKNGVLLGALIGAGGGVPLALTVAAYNANEGGSGAWAAVPILVGMVVGTGIDAVLGSKKTLYDRTSNRRITLSPVIDKHGLGARVAFLWSWFVQGFQAARANLLLRGNAATDRRASVSFRRRTSSWIRAPDFLRKPFLFTCQFPPVLPALRDRSETNDANNSSSNDSSPGRVRNGACAAGPARGQGSSPRNLRLRNLLRIRPP